jgi:hypothetical protein
VQDVLEHVDSGSLEDLPVGLDGGAYRWADLRGEGISCGVQTCRTLGRMAANAIKKKEFAVDTKELGRSDLGVWVTPGGPRCRR